MKRFLLFAAFMILSFFLSRHSYHMITTLMKPADPVTVVIDSGHGGNDPGKVGIHDILEKDINLSIANYLKSYLENSDVHVVMTRTSDQSLSNSSKTSDLSNRKEVIFKNNPIAAISIHQNSYPAPSVHGAQVFYALHSEKGKTLADLLQKELLEMDSSNHRTSKSNSSYFLFKDNPYATVIVECGFLSNPEESAKLTDPAYQKKIAWHLHLGIMTYINQYRFTKQP